MTASSLFPYDAVREVQDDLLHQVYDVIDRGRDLIAHAPTGLGKTAATLAPALTYALEKDLSVFFLTSRHTQHRLAVETLRDIRNKHGKDIVVADIVGKKWMCAQPGADALFSNEFMNYCRALRENKECTFYENVKKGEKLSDNTKAVLEQMKEPHHTEDVVAASTKAHVCPYEIAALAADKATVVVCDYNYLFSESIRDSFLRKINKSLSKSIIIIDEGHNLPARTRELLTQQLTTVTIERSLTEARKFGTDDHVAQLQQLRDVLSSLSQTADPERVVTRQEFMDAVRSFDDYEKLIADFTFLADEVREKQRQSSLGSVAEFLEA